MTSIGEGAFTGCKELTSIGIPYSVVNIGGNIFGSCSSLASIKVDDNNTVYDSREQCNAIITTTTNELIAGCANTIIPNTVTSIGAGAFVGSGLKSITIPNSVTNIGPYGFGWCSSLLSVNFPERLKTISESMFIACPSLTAIVIPNNVDSIGERAFNCCTGLTSVIIGDNVKAIGMYAFAGSGVSELTIGCNVKTIYSCAFADCYNLKQLVIPNSVTLLDGWAFGHCSGLVTVTLGNSVASINGAFANCDSILSITSFNPIPPNASWGFSPNINYNQAILRVPVGCKEAYRNANGWKNFMNIEVNDIAIDEENFPDNNFRAYLREQSYGEDGILSNAEIESIKEIDVAGLGISSLKGIECFTELTYLECAFNKLTELNLSKNTVLTFLDCLQNNISNLDVSCNTDLKNLSCSSNPLTSLNVSKNLLLESLDCVNDQLTNLDVSKNTALKDLTCYHNQLTSLDVSNCIALEYLNCSDNQLTNLEVSKNVALTELRCDINHIKDEEMDALVNSLPIKEEAWLLVMSLTNPSEGNVCTKGQVNVAKEKGWKVLAENNLWIEYEGSNPSGIQHVTMDKKSINVYDLNGRKLKEPIRGINIIKGKKLMVK